MCVNMQERRFMQDVLRSPIISRNDPMHPLETRLHTESVQKLETHFGFTCCCHNTSVIKYFKTTLDWKDYIAVLVILCFPGCVCIWLYERIQLNSYFIWNNFYELLFLVFRNTISQHSHHINSAFWLASLAIWEVWGVSLS